MESINLQKKIEQEMHEAMKQHDEALLSTLRMLRSAISNRVIEKRSSSAKATKDKPTSVDLSDEEVLEVIRSEAKRRRDAVFEFTKAGRKELADKESAELKILEKYLPAELSDEEIERLAAETIAETKAESEKDFGRVMGGVMKKAAGRASGDRVSVVVKRMLTGQ